jgi:HAD superfamily hydrolase (TIGR01450 family)
LADIRYLLIDMDGIVYYDGAGLAGTHEFLEFLRQHDIQFAFATNATNSWPRDHRTRLAGYGVETDHTPIYTAGMAAADYVREEKGPGTKVFVIGGDGFKQLMVERGECILSETRPDAVVIGWTPDFNVRHLEVASRAVFQGADLLAADPDVNEPSQPTPLPGSGSFAAAIEAVTGAKATPIGKPNSILFEMALKGIGGDVDHAAMIGDRLDTDVKGGLAMGLCTILVLTGYTTREILAESSIKPDWVMEDLDDLRQRWKKALER